MSENLWACTKGTPSRTYTHTFTSTSTHLGRGHRSFHVLLVPEHQDVRLLEFVLFGHRYEFLARILRVDTLLRRAKACGLESRACMHHKHMSSQALSMYLSRGHRSLHVLLVREHQDVRLLEFVLLEHRHEFLACGLQAIDVARVDNKDNRVSVRVVKPTGANTNYAINYGIEFRIP